MEWDGLETQITNSLLFLSGPEARQRNMEAQRYNDNISWMNDFINDRPLQSLNLNPPQGGRHQLCLGRCPGQGGRQGQDQGQGQGVRRTRHEVTQVTCLPRSKSLMIKRSYHNGGIKDNQIFHQTD